MQTTALTAVFWNPTGASLSYPIGYQGEIEQFLADVEANSGKESDFFSVLPQYYEEASGKINHVTYSVTVEPAQNDTTGLPTGTGEKCTSPFNASRPCVTDLGVQRQLVSYIKAHSLPTGIGHEYVVFFPPGMESCFAETGPEAAICSGKYYCGYHGSLEAGTAKEVEYANEPDNADPQYGLGCLPEEGLKAGYATIDSTSHEVSESVTDPEVGSEIAGKERLSWYDKNRLYVEPLEEEFEYGEIGDMCAYEYRQGDEALEYLSENGAFDSNGTPNQTINGHQYLLQLEWDNAHSTCSLSAEAALTKATFTDGATGPTPTGQPISFDGTGSHGPADKHIKSTIETYEWNWGDGSVTSTKSPMVEHAYASTQGAVRRTFTVTLKVIDGNGDNNSTSHSVEIEDRSPTAAFTPPLGATAGTTTQLDGSPSSDPDGTIAQYKWSFGDGSGATGSAPTHVYANPGEYTVTLEITDDAGETASVSHSVSVGVAPPAGQSSIPSAQPGSTKQSGVAATGTIRVTRVKQNKKRGTVALSVSVSGAGLLSVREAGGAHLSLVSPIAAIVVAPTAYPIALSAKAKVKGPFVKPVSVNIRSAGTVTLQIAASAAGRARLLRQHKLVVNLLIAFTPTGGNQVTVSQTVTLALSAGKKGK